MIPISKAFVLLPFLGYAEVHYRLFGLPSRYFMREPEIIADVPFRVRAGQPLPVLLMVKDADRYPVELIRLAVRAGFDDGQSILVYDQELGHSVHEPFLHRLFFCTLPLQRRGRVYVDVAIDYIVEGKRRRCFNDNYRLTSHDPFVVTIDENAWPRLPNWKLGETHCHSYFSNDQVEFGPPLSALPTIARALELDFIAVTDHSYDLDDRVDDYLRNDPELPKWRELQKTVERLNRGEPEVLFIPGEELSVGNHRGRNVHLLLYADPEFYVGTGDGAERFLRNKPEYSLQEVLDRLAPHALAIAAHPQTKPPLLQKLLLRRGHWSRHDLSLPRLDGAQFWNGNKKEFLRVGLKHWIARLLEGRRLTLIAGNDAHGSFNRFRQIGTPHISLREEIREIFGRARTAVRIDGSWTLQSLLEALRRGCVVCTDGPMLEAEWESGSTLYRIGDEAPPQAGTLHLRLASSPVFGAFQCVQVIIGDCRTKKETRKRLKIPSGLYDHSLSLRLEKLPQVGYLRVEAVTLAKGQNYHCFANPIYLR
ncbi:MAG: CehA/McbA family metallohydrolase [candidate division KSB1 bacterium]|nr:CehA/McbA family metallohydrolase [candidate division KSB1 bacterium]